MASGRMHNPHPTTPYPLLAISYRNHQRVCIFQSLGTISIVLFTKRQNQKGGMTLLPRPSPQNPLLLWTIKMQKYFRSFCLKAEAWLK